MRLRNVLPVIPLILATTLAANAQPFQGVYVGAGAGYNITQAVKTTPLSSGLGSNILHLDEGGGFAGVGSLGYGFGNGLRLEVEGDFRRDGLQQLNGTPFPTSASGNVKRYGAMANAMFDIDIGVAWLYPYIGVGAGYQWTNLHNVVGGLDHGSVQLRDQRHAGRLRLAGDRAGCRSRCRTCRVFR